MKKSSKKANWMAGIALACTPAGGLALCGGVVASILYVLLTLVLLIPVKPAFSQTASVAAGVRLEAGIEKEDVDGDLKAAMDIYQKIAADASATARCTRQGTATAGRMRREAGQAGQAGLRADRA